MEEAALEHPYDRYGEAYRDWWAPIIAPAAVRLLDRLEPLVPADASFDLLDVGTGTGTLVLAALERWPRASAVAIDPSGRMLELAAEEARRRGRGLADRLRVGTGSADRLPLADDSIDVAVSSFVIQLVPSRAAALREVGRVLRPGGIFASVTWQLEDARFEPDQAFELAADELDIELPMGGRDPRPYTSPEAAAAELRRAGFGDVKGTLVWLEHRYTPESYAGLLENWIEDDVYSSLEEEWRQRLRSTVLRKLRAIEPEGFVWRRPLVSVVGRRR